MSGRLRVGCSGWQYKHWRGDFYPDHLPESRWLEYYAAQFDTVEINNSFYRLPLAVTFQSWRDRVTPPFVFAVKASRYLTHMKKLKDPAESVDLLFSRATYLRGALGPVLYQLPPRLRLNLDRLDEFLRALPAGHQHVIEFRDSSWYVPDVFERLGAHGVALCLHDMGGSATGLQRVGPLVYARFHGPGKYRGGYSDETLGVWSSWCAGQVAQGVTVYAFFNNDIEGHAPRDAIRFREMASSLREAAPPARQRHR